VTPTSVAIVVAAVIVALILSNAFEAAHTTLGWVVACSVVALLLDPLVGFVDRFLPRLLSVILVLLAVVTVVAGVTIGLASDLNTSLEELRDAAPEAAQELEERYDVAREIGVADRVESFIKDLDENVRSDALTAAAETVPTYVVTGILMLFILGYGRRYFAAFVDQFAPQRRPLLRSVLSGAARRGQRYLLAVLAHSIVNGVIFGTTCSLVGLPASRSLGIAVGFFTLFPLIGVLVGGIPALLLAFGLDGWGTGFIVLAVLIALQLVEALIVRPFVDVRTVRLGPTVAIVVALLGFELYGIGGAVYGVALAVIGLAALDELGAPAPSVVEAREEAAA
jgi:predicted PurR-regulated permease PerM